MPTGLRKSPGKTVNPYKLSALHLRQQVPNTPRPPLKIDGLAAVVTQVRGGAEAAGSPEFPLAHGRASHRTENGHPQRKTEGFILAKNS